MPNWIRLPKKSPCQVCRIKSALEFSRCRRLRACIDYLFEKESINDFLLAVVLPYCYENCLAADTHAL